ncbi:hypothetical protein LCGC14_1728450 [marine sediment metagenome]|uniref:Uncharacterized protein n=1 Tax=marine sediment metagenome TaxID=412755 RepID=A0A0F9K9Z6_9ZZZZ
MTRVLGYGGIANTNGARDFSGKTEAVGVSGNVYMRQMGYVQSAMRGFRSILFLLMGA